MDDSRLIVVGCPALAIALAGLVGVVTESLAVFGATPSTSGSIWPSESVSLGAHRTGTGGSAS